MTDESETVDLASALQRAAEIIATHGASPDVVLVHPVVHRRLLEHWAYVDRVGYEAAALTSKKRARLVTRYSGGRHARQRGRKRYAR